MSAPTHETTSRWDEATAPAPDDLLGACVYASRLAGADPALVLAGGGNSSVKTTEADVHGDPVEVLWVKGSGWDMASIEPAGFAPLRLAPVARLAELERLSDRRMANELKAASIDASAPAPSVESILHATLPHRFVLHTHADAVVALTNTPDGRDIVHQVYGDELVVVPYVMPGFDLARLCAQIFPAEATDATRGMVLLNHGLFTFADDARTAYEHHVELVARAVTHLDAAHAAFAHDEPEPVARPDTDEQRLALAELRRDVSRHAGHPMVMCICTAEATRRFAARPDLDRVSQQGTATPDHVLRTKRLPLLGRDVAAYADAYQAYVDRNRARLGGRHLVPVDPAPRIVIDPALGVLATGRRPPRRGRGGPDLRPHRLGHRAGRSPGRLPQHLRSRPVRRRVLGARAGQAQPRARSRTSGRPGGPGHRRGLGHRPGLHPRTAGPGRGGGRSRPVRPGQPGGHRSRLSGRGR